MVDFWEGANRPGTDGYGPLTPKSALGHFYVLYSRSIFAYSVAKPVLRVPNFLNVNIKMQSFSGAEIECVIRSLDESLPRWGPPGVGSGGVRPTEGESFV